MASFLESLLLSLKDCMHHASTQICYESDEVPLSQATKISRLYKRYTDFRVTSGARKL